MPKRKAKTDPEVIQMVLATQEREKAAYADYQRAQDEHLAALRKAREFGETCENLADALGCSKQWIHKWTKHGRDHNKVYNSNRN